MHEVNSIRTLRRKGESIASISRIVGHSEQTIRKYLEEQDLSPKQPIRQSRSSVHDAYRDVIEQWLEEDAKTWSKQHHTAKRIWERLRDEHGCTTAQSTVRHYVACMKAERHLVRDQFLDLIREPGDAQVDFGEFDLHHYGVRSRLSFLVIDFPFSNQGFAQVTLGQNAECVCEGLQSIFEYIGGIPKRLVFDNATGVGRKACDGVRTTGLFDAFSAHHGFEFTFCNPHSGNEKGGVENKVGAIRRALFVPLPRVTDVDIYNRHLPQHCDGLSVKGHYGKGEPESQPFVQDCLTLMGLPSARFDVVRYERHHADKYGKVTLGGNHRYSSDPTYARQELIVGIKATRVLLYDSVGTLVSEHERAYGKAPSDSTEPARLALRQARRLAKQSGRRCFSEDLRR